VPGSIGFQPVQAGPPAGQAPRLLIVSQPRGLDGKTDFVDMGYFLARAVKDLGRYDVCLYKPTEAVVTDAIKSGRLEAGDAGSYLGQEAARKVAEAIGAVYIVQVSAARSRQGIGATAEMRVRLAGKWSTIFSTTLAPFKSRSRRSELLDAIHAHVTALTPRIGSAPAVPAASIEKPPTTPDGGADSPTVTRPGQAAQSQTSGPTTADILMDRFRKSGDTANLIVTLRKAVTERPRDPKLRRELVGALRLRGWTEAARDEAARALALCPETADLHYLLGQGYLDMGQFPEAMKELGEAVRLEPASASYRVALGDAYLAQSKLAEAETAYKDALAADPKSPLPQFRMARLRAQALRFAEASDALAQARKAAGSADDAAYAATYMAILSIMDGAGQDVAAGLTTARKDFLAGTLSREQAHKAAAEYRDRAGAMTAFLSDNSPPQGYAAVQALYVQATALLAQASGVFESYLETRDEAEDREATLLRQEAARLLADASKKAKQQVP